MFDPLKIKQDFPIFKRLVNGKPLVYLDSTATSLKPQSVINAVNDYYAKYSANIFRGIYSISEEATAKYEESRAKIASFIGSQNPAEIIFVRNATEGINLIAYSWGSRNLDKNSEIVATVMEHHANIVPWQVLSETTGSELKFIDIDNNGVLKLENLDRIITRKTKLLAMTYISNVLGTINPVKEIIRKAKSINPKLKVLIDAAQAVPHMKVDVRDLGCDFLVFSGHKMLGPTGIGVLWGKYDILESMDPFQYGGEMIEEVTLTKTIYKKPPYKFEAGTPHIAGSLGLSAAIDYLHDLGMANIRRHEIELTKYALQRMAKEIEVTYYGPTDAQQRGGVIAFNVRGIHSHDVAQVLDQTNVCIRSGHHCAMPLHHRLNIPSSCRASFYIYSTTDDIDRLFEGLQKARQVFKS